MNDAEAHVIAVARDIVARYRAHLGPLGAQALVNAVDRLPSLPSPVFPVATGIPDPSSAVPPPKPAFITEGPVLEGRFARESFEPPAVIEVVPTAVDRRVVRRDPKDPA